MDGLTNCLGMILLLIIIKNNKRKRYYPPGRPRRSWGKGLKVLKENYELSTADCSSLNSAVCLYDVSFSDEDMCEHPIPASSFHIYNNSIEDQLSRLLYQTNRRQGLHAKHRGHSRMDKVILN